MMSQMNVIFVLIVCASTVKSNNETQVNNDVPAEKYFLDYLFNKYGNNGKISYEGFEHLLDSLGLGQLKFSHKLEKHKNVNGSFQEVHDKLKLHTHNHLDRRRRSTHDVEKSKANSTVQNLYKKGIDHCYTPEEMLMIYKLEPNHQLGLSPNNFLHICPVLVFQLDQKSCVPGYAEVKSNSVEPDLYVVWILATLSVLIISLAGLIGICIVPFLQRMFFKEILGFLMALAVGTLCGDALLHLLPHAFQLHDDEDPNNVTYRAGIVFLSILVFFVIGNFMNSHGHTHEETPSKAEFALSTVKGEEIESGAFLESSHKHAATSPNLNLAYMVIMGDGLHNLTDGLAIGAAFAGDVVSGITTAIAVLTHELPHELGDFAVLLKTGMTFKQAIFYNIVSSVMSLIGVFVGLLLTNLAYASSWIYSITAGVFLYIALVNLVPELKKSTENSLSALLINLAGLLAGAGIMFLIAIYEHDLENLLEN